MTETLAQPSFAELGATTAPMTRVDCPAPDFGTYSLPAITAPPTPPSQAAILLSDQGDTPNGNASRLLIGLTGIALLGPITPSALFLANKHLESAISVGSWLSWCGLQMLSYAAVAALALTVALPGLWILLGIFDIQLNLHRVLNAVSRAYLRAGLFCLGFVPCILLYCTTGADQTLMMFSGTSCYFVAGALGLWSLAIELRREVQVRKGIGTLLLLGWLGLSMLLGAYLFVKSQIWLFALEGVNL